MIDVRNGGKGSEKGFVFTYMYTFKLVRMFFSQFQMCEKRKFRSEIFVKFHIYPLRKIHFFGRSETHRRRERQININSYLQSNK